MTFIDWLYNLFVLQEFFGNTLSQYFYFFGIIAFALLVGKTLYWVFENVVRKFTQKTETLLDDILLDSVRKPVILVIVIIGFFLGSKTLTLSPSMAIFFGNVVEFLVILNAGWFLISFVDSMIQHYVMPFAQKTETELDDHLVPVIRTLLKVILFAITLVVGFSNIGFDVGAFLAGLGIGGLAFAFAAKDLIANLFGGITILADKPFKIGDMVEVKGKRGTVLEIGMRTTKIRTIDNTVIIIPNSNITVDLVENVTAGGERRFKFTIGVTYDTPAKKLAQAMDIIKKAINSMPGANTERTLVFFDQFNSHSLDITAIYFMKSMDGFLVQKTELNMTIKKAFEKAKISMAFPTQTLEIVKKK